MPDHAAPDPFGPVVPGSSDPLTTHVQRALDSFVEGQTTRLSALGPQLAPLLEAARSYVSAGKRLRAAYCYWGWRAAGGSPDDVRVLSAAAALEWLHGSALVHDDVMDGSDQRRGQPAAHRRFERLHQESTWRGSPSRFGQSAAILLGDLMLSWAEQMFRGSGLGVEAISRALPYLDDCTSEVVAGQFLDVVSQASGSTDADTALHVLRFKSAKYTVERPLQVGAALAGAGPELIAALSDYGVPVGEAFQLRDDVLGVFGDPAVTGKPAGDDLREGKRTLLVALAWAQADPTQRGMLDRLGDPSLEAAAIDQLATVLVDTGALAAVERRISALEEQGRVALSAAPIDVTARAVLGRLAELSTRRSA